MEYTLVILKPDTVSKNQAGAVLAAIERDGLKVIGLKRLQLSRRLAQKFYAEHKGKDFYEGLVDFMTSGPVVAVALAGSDAIKRARLLMGATDPSQAASGTIRAEFGGGSMPDNAIHGSDSPESAKRELSFFFAEVDLIDD
ncbi:MAG: nucleoside-diphosphate kinase [bacterium]